MNLVDHARREMKAAGLFDKDADYGGMLADSVMELIQKFADQGHSGASASMTRQLFAKLADFQPLGPLTGADSEWVKVSEGIWQNNRCSHVFKEADGRAYDSQGIVFEEPDGGRYLSSGSRVFIEFPYTPKTEVVKRPASPES